MKKKYGQFILLGLAILIPFFGLLACTHSDKDPADTKAPVAEEFVIFENGSYQCEFVCSGESGQDILMLRNELRQLLKDKFGVAPSFKTDSKYKEDTSKKELLFGNTNRTQSALSGVKNAATDAYAIVAVANDKLVINGTNAVWVQKALERFEAYLQASPADRFAIPGNTREEQIVPEFFREGWGLLELPAYPAGASNTLNHNLYNCGSTIQNIAVNSTEKDTFAQKVEDTNAEEFAAYIEKLKSFGYAVEYEHEMEENLYVSLCGEGQRVYLSYTPKKTSSMKNTAMIFYEANAMSLKEFGYTYTPKAGERSEYYLYGIPMFQGVEKTDFDLKNAPNCGSLMVIKCADNSVIVIDGGEDDYQMTEEAMQGFDSFLRRITSTPAGEKVRISAWYLTHYHPDHSEGFPLFLKNYHSGYTLERIIANVPKRGDNLPGGIAYYYTSLEGTAGFLNSTYPSCKELKVHTGQVIQIADVSLQVVYTHEDLLKPETMEFGSSDTNNTSTVIRVDNGQLSMLVLGDISTSGETKLMQKLSEKTLRSDIVQVAHHGYNHVPAIYAATKPSIAFYTNSRGGEREYATIAYPNNYFDDVKALVGGEEHCYWGGNETVGFAFVDGELKLIYRQDGVVGFHLNPDGSRKNGFS